VTANAHFASREVHRIDALNDRIAAFIKAHATGEQTDPG
jgi:hypothetical protein